jgi:sugar phosphate isomerase/epimerase
MRGKWAAPLPFGLITEPAEVAHDPQTPASPFSVDRVGISLETLVPDRSDPSTRTPAAFARIAEGAAAAGFRTVALSADRVVELGIQQARRILDDAGVDVKVVELVTYWAEGPDAATNGVEGQLDAVEGLGARLFLAVAQQPEMDMGRAAEGFAALSERAAKRNIQVAIEFVPNRALCDLATALEVVQRSGAPNAGIDLDMKHWQNQPNGPDLDLLRSVAGQQVLYVQVCDAFPPDSGTPQYLPSRIQDRPLPGDGVVDIPGILEALSDIGADPYFAAEVFSASMAANGAEFMATRIREAVRLYFA